MLQPLVPTGCDTNKVIGQETEIVIHPLTSQEFRLMGLNNAQIPGWTTDTIPDDSFDRKIVGKIPGSRTYTDTQFTCYLISREPAQEELRMLSLTSLEFNDIFYYYVEKVKGHHFWALDLIEDPCGKVNISGFAPQAYGRSELVNLQFNLNVNGAGAHFEYHTPDGMEYDVASGYLTVYPPHFSFSELGFQPGMIAIIEAPGTPPYFCSEITSVADKELGLASPITRDGTGIIHGARLSVHTNTNMQYTLIGGVLTVQFLLGDDNDPGFSFITLGFRAGMICKVENGGSFFYAEIAAGGVSGMTLRFMYTTTTMTGNGVIHGGYVEYHTPNAMEYEIDSGTLVATLANFSFIRLGFKDGMVCIVETGDPSNPYFYAKIKKNGVEDKNLTFIDTTLARGISVGAIHGARVR